MSSIQNQGKGGVHFENWSKTYSCSPELYFEPRTVEEIKQILAEARQNGKKVKAVGAGHSPSDLACTTDYMISLKNFNRVLKFDIEKLQVSVQGGCYVSSLNEMLAANGMALSVQGAVSDLTVAGIISTGTHGTGINYTNVSGSVVDMEIMLASGEIMRFSATENAELLPVVALSLGSVGIILSVTFQCEKSFNLHARQFPSTLKDAIENLQTYVKSCDHFRMNWYPYTDSLTCFMMSRTKEPPSPNRSASSWLWDDLVGYHLLQGLLYTSSFVPSLVPYINRLYFQLQGKVRSEKVDRSDRVFNFDCLFQQFVMEWALPIENTGAALLELHDWIVKSRFPAHLNVEIRFVKGDNNYLSPCYQQDSCYINIIMYRPYGKTIPHDAYWNAYQDIIAKHGGRPHWAKDHKFTAEDFQKLYPKWSEFCAAREKLDPNGMFLNSYLERVFGSKVLAQSKL